MNKVTHDQQHGEPHHARGHDWKRLHHHWYFWVGMLLMVAALVIYVMTEDLAWVPRSQPQ
jgi:hypothetical protein